MGQNPCTFGTHQDAIAGYVQQKSCRVWNVGGYRRGNPLLHAGISMTKISKTLQLSGGFKEGHNWITNYQPKQCTYYGQITQIYRTFAVFDSSQDGYFSDPWFNPNWNQLSNWIISPSRGNKTHLKTPPSLHPAPVLSKSLVFKKATLSSSFVFSFDNSVVSLTHLLFENLIAGIDLLNVHESIVANLH